MITHHLDIGVTAGSVDMSESRLQIEAFDNRQAEQPRTIFEFPDEDQPPDLSLENEIMNLPPCQSNTKRVFKVTTRASLPGITQVSNHISYSFNFL